MTEKRIVRMAPAFAAAIVVAALAITSNSQTGRPRYSSTGPDQTWTVPEGTVISLRIDDDLSSRTSHVGDKFAATVTIPVYVGGRTVIPAGAIIEGSVTGVTPAKRMSKSGTISVGFDALVFPNGDRVKINGSLTSADPAERRRINNESTVSGDNGKRSVVFIGGGGAVGAVLGGISGGGTGAIAGGIIGAGSGVAAVLLSKGAEAEVRSGTSFGIQLSHPLDLGEGVVSQVGSEPPSPDRDRDYQGPDPGRQGPDTGRQGPDSDRQPSDSGRPGPDYGRPDSSMPDSGQPRGGRDRSDRGDSGQPPYYSRRRRSPDNPSPSDSPDARSQPDTARAEPPPAEPSYPRSQPDGGRSAPPPAEPSYPLSSAEMTRRAQGALRDQGYYEGAVDGTMSPRTSAAIRSYQRDHNLPETGDLDPGTARSLGILGGGPQAGGGPSAGGPPSDSPSGGEGRAPVDSGPTRDTAGGSRRSAGRDPGRDNADPRDSASGDMPANVLGATANRTSDGAIHVLVQTQANSGGWRWYGEHRVSGDTLEIDARAIKPTGYATQVLTRGKIEMNIRDDVQNVSRVVVHGAGQDVEVPLGGSRVAADPRRVGDRRSSGGSGPSRERAGGFDPSAGRGIQRQADDLLSEYRRMLGFRTTSSGVEPGRARYAESEIALLFAFDSFASAARLYVQVAPSLGDPEGLRGATLALAREARRADKLITTSDAQAAQAVAARWDTIRQDVLRLMDSQNIQASEIEDREE
jgi:hypothetical protein